MKMWGLGKMVHYLQGKGCGPVRVFKLKVDVNEAYEYAMYPLYQIITPRGCKIMAIRGDWKSVS